MLDEMEISKMKMRLRILMIIWRNDLAIWRVERLKRSSSLRGKGREGKEEERRGEENLCFS